MRLDLGHTRKSLRYIIELKQESMPPIEIEKFDELYAPLFASQNNNRTTGKLPKTLP